MTAFRLRVDGLPQGKGRPRFGRGRIFTPRATRSYESMLAWSAKVEMRGRPMLTGALSLKVIATLPGVPTAKPDFDNIAKLVADALQGVVYQNDAVITHAEIDKMQGVPGLEIEVCTL